MKHILISAAVAAALTLALATEASGAGSAGNRSGYRGWGPRFGLTMDPDQVHVGAHFDFGQFAANWRFQPNVEAGFGDNLTLIALNLEAAYRFSNTWESWSPYLGGGMGLNIFNLDDDNNNNHNDDWNRDHDSDTDVGASVVAGLEKGGRNGDRFFFETKLGLLGGSPDLKLTLGWTFL